MIAYLEADYQMKNHIKKGVGQVSLKITGQINEGQA